MIDDSVPPRPAASPEDASDSLEQRVHELEALALDQGIVFNQEVIRLLASLQFLKAQPAVEYSGALLAAHDTADRYAHFTRLTVLPPPRCLTTPRCSCPQVHAAVCTHLRGMRPRLRARLVCGGCGQRRGWRGRRDGPRRSSRSSVPHPSCAAPLLEQRLGRRAKTMCAHRFLPCTVSPVPAAARSVRRH